MKSFLDGRESISAGGTSPGKITKGAEFKPMNVGTGASSAGAATNDDLQEIPNPENNPNAPKVEYVRDGEMISRIIVTFGEHKVEIDCQY